MRIFLIGMPGAGKSTLGQQTAIALNLDFHDLDVLIVEKTGMEITEIFRERGEEYFRKIEAKILKEVVQDQDDFVMATGGGTPCFYQNIELN